MKKKINHNLKKVADEVLVQQLPKLLHDLKVTAKGIALDDFKIKGITGYELTVSANKTPELVLRLKVNQETYSTYYNNNGKEVNILKNL